MTSVRTAALSRNELRHHTRQSIPHDSGAPATREQDSTAASIWRTAHKDFPMEPSDRRGTCSRWWEARVAGSNGVHCQGAAGGRHVPDMKLIKYDPDLFRITHLASFLRPPGSPPPPCSIAHCSAPSRWRLARAGHALSGACSCLRSAAIGQEMPRVCKLRSATARHWQGTYGAESARERSVGKGGGG